MPDTPMTDQMFNWVVTSSRMVATMTRANADLNCPVKVAVCVRKPGPIAEVAIRKAAPMRAVILFFLSHM